MVTTKPLNMPKAVPDTIPARMAIPAWTPFFSKIAIITPVMDTIPPKERSMQPIIRHMDMAVLRIIITHACVSMVVILPGVKKLGTITDASTNATIKT